MFETLANHPLSCASLPAAMNGRLRVGMDLVQISRIRESLDRFGQRFIARLFTADEIAYACSAPALQAERLAGRFAAKEAAIKAFDLGEAGVDWRDIEVRRASSGACSLKLHRKLEALAPAPSDTSLCISHDGDYAAAVLVVLAPTPINSSKRWP